VTASYLSPALFEKQTEQQKVKTVNRGRVREPELDIVAWKDGVAKELLLPAIERIDGLKIKHLRAMTVLNPQEVAALGGPEDEIPCVRDELTPDIQAKVDAGEMSREQGLAEAKDQAESNILWLLKHSNDFYEYVMDVTTRLPFFQDEDWENRVANFANGRRLNSE
jgi:hypothetical protein